MKLVFPISALFACVFLFLYLPLFAVYCEVLDTDFDQYKLDKSLELSTRAAAENGLTHGLVTFDNELLQDVEFNDSVVLTTYAQFMCFNYNLVPTEVNMEYVLGRSVLMAVGGRGFNVTQCEFGDYYMGADGALYRVNGAVDPGQTGTHEAATNSGSRTIFGTYVPFTVQDTNAPENITRLVSGSLLPNAVVFPVFERNHTTGKVNVYPAEALPGNVTVSRVQHEALALMTRAFAQAWNQLNMQSASDKQLTLPNTITNLGVSSAANPGVMAMVEGFDLGSFKSLRSEAFTGYKAVLRREVVAFTQTINGWSTHWYCYRDQFNMEHVPSGVTVDYVYPDMLAAAEAKIFICSAAHDATLQCTSCTEENGNVSDPHCHYQPHLGYLSN